MKTKKFLMTSLLVMGMIIAKAANGYPPELVLVSQPVLTYNANSVTVYYDVQNIGDYTYRGDVVIYLDPDNGFCFGSEYIKVRPGSIRRVAITIPAYRANPSWIYTVMPYYELYDELFSFTMFEYFEPVRFCWNGYRNEPWIVIHVGPRPKYYHRPGNYRYYYDGYHPMLPPPPSGGHHAMPPMDPHHHTYGYHHDHGGYPANYIPEHETPGYNKPSEATVVHPNGGNTSGSMSSRTNVTVTPNNGGGATTRPSTGNSGSSGTTVRPSTNSGSSSSSSGTRPSANSGNSDSNNGRSGSSSTRSSNTSSSSSSSSVSRPSSNSSSSSSSSVSRPSSNSSSSSSSNVSRPSSNSSSNRSGSSSSSSSSGRSSSSSSSSSSSRSSSSSSSSSRTSSSSGRR